MSLSQITRRHFTAVGLSSVLWGLAPSALHAQSPKRLLVVGDSLSAEYGIAKGSGWVRLLEQRVQAQGLAWQVINASISGDTTAGGRSRLPALLKTHQPHLVVIELGANDALRGLSLKASEDNLRAMIRAARAQGAQVVLVGMEIPPNFGARYTRAFRSLFQRVAQQDQVPLVPFLLAGIADVPDAASWFQSDRIHPLAKAHPRLLDNVWSILRPLL
jgi:acyl-CoA thioesterase-1